MKIHILRLVNHGHLDIDVICLMPVCICEHCNSLFFVKLSLVLREFCIEVMIHLKSHARDFCRCNGDHCATEFRVFELPDLQALNLFALECYIIAVIACKIFLSLR